MSNGKPIRFVILSQPRTGSTLLCSLLNSHPGIRALCEPINPRGHSHHMQPKIGSNCLLPERMVQNNLNRAFNILFNVDPPPIEFINSRKLAPVAAGFKIMAHQIQALKSETFFWEYLRDNQIPVILCFRYNILMQYVSDRITTVTRQPACWDGEVKTAQVMIHIPTLQLEFKRIVDEKLYLINKVNEYNLVKYRVKYEDFKDDVTPIENILFQLIGEKYHLTTKLSKQNPDSLRARVINYDELVKEVQRLRLGHLVDNNSGE